MCVNKVLMTGLFPFLYDNIAARSELGLVGNTAKSRYVHLGCSIRVGPIGKLETVHILLVCCLE